MLFLLRLPPPSRVAHETPIRQSRRENTLGRGVVLASRFRRSGCGPPLRGLACAGIAAGKIRGALLKWIVCGAGHYELRKTSLRTPDMSRAATEYGR